MPGMVKGRRRCTGPRTEARWRCALSKKQTNLHQGVVVDFGADVDPANVDPPADVEARSDEGAMPLHCAAGRGSLTARFFRLAS